MSSHIALLESELKRIDVEQGTALARLRSSGAREILTKTRDDVWGAGEIEINTGVIDFAPVDWLKYDKERMTDSKWDTVNPGSYLRTLKHKVKVLKQGADPDVIMFGVDQQRFRGWAGMSLVLYYPDTIDPDIRSGMLFVDYSRIGPYWTIMREGLTIGSFEDNFGYAYKVDSKKTTGIFSSPNDQIADKIAEYVRSDSEKRTEGYQDINNDELASRLGREAIPGLRLSPIIFPMGIKVNEDPSKGVLLYSGFLDRQMERVARSCNNPFNTETVQDSWFTREIFEDKLSKGKPWPRFPSFPDQRAELLDIKFLPVEK